jgi:hypothetical protein
MKKRTLAFWLNCILLLFPFLIICAQDLKNPSGEPTVSPVVLQWNQKNIISEITSVIEIKQNRYAHWTPVIENLVTKLLWEGYPIEDNGTAFGEIPTNGAYPGQEIIRGYQGKYLVNSKMLNLGTTVGKLISDPFIITGDRIDFLIAGGDFGKYASLNLLIHDTIVRQTSGDFSSNLKRKYWDVSDYKGEEAHLLIVDQISKDYFCNPPFDQLKDRYPFILVDDIRQTTMDVIPVNPSEDKSRNFDFETINAPAYKVIQTKSEDGLNTHLREFAIEDEGGKTVGKFHYNLHTVKINSYLLQLKHEWTYSGKKLQGVKFKLINKIPLTSDQTQFYVIPGLLYNGNNIGIRAHYLNENFPEDATTIPGGYSVESDTKVYAGWVQPQQNALDPPFSLALQKDEKQKVWKAIYSVPASVNLALSDTLAQDEDHRLNVENGFSLFKITYIYLDTKKQYSNVSNQKAGYGQMVNAAWNTFYPESKTNPPHTLKEDYNLKMQTLLDPKALIQEVTVNSKTYRIWMVGRYILGKDFNFNNSELIPLKYIFNYTGFSWSGMLETAAYNGIQDFLRNGDSTALNLAVNSLDFFADNGMSAIGILYPNWDGNLGFSSVWSKDLIDMGHLGDGLSGYLKCYRLMKQKDLGNKDNWLLTVKTSLDNIMKRFPDGDVPGRINGNTGEAAYRDGILYTKPSLGGPDGINFLIWAFADYYNLTHEVKYLYYAEKMGDIVLYVMGEFGVMSGMEADYFNVDKRMFHGALAAFNRLYENTGKKKWLEASELAGNAFGSWEYCYNVNFSACPDLPNAHFDYRSIGGTPVDIKYSTNNTNFQQGATEFLKLWTVTGEMMWFERARAILHQGTQLSLTEEKRIWLNEHFQQPAKGYIRSFNPTNTFDSHLRGGGTEDVMMSWLFKGIWTSRFGGILSMYMLTQGFESADLILKYGSICYNYQWNAGGAIDMLDDVKIVRDINEGILTITARNMIAAPETYSLKLLNYKGQEINIDGHTFNKQTIEAGIPINFNASEVRTIRVKEIN